jgi:hypothetical protein|uniref:Photosystem II subunit T n=1 Tax=Karlodinium veneficum TaxID=407301 RepID=A0A067XSC7_KARVE|nr:photosystem II subunit T [Karlodinium veneficum]
MTTRKVESDTVVYVFLIISTLVLITCSIFFRDAPRIYTEDI